MKNLKTIFITLALFLMSFSFVSAASNLDSGFAPCNGTAVFAKSGTDGCSVTGATCTSGVAKGLGSYGNNGEGCYCNCDGGSMIGQIDINKTSLTSIIGNIIKIILGLSGLVALIFTIWGGVEWMFSQGDPETIKKAKNRIINGAVGIIIIASAYAISDFVIKALSRVA